MLERIWIYMIAQFPAGKLGFSFVGGVSGSSIWDIEIVHISLFPF
jgi:hypothetical protein